MKQPPGRPVPKKDGLGDQNLELGDHLVVQYLLKDALFSIVAKCINQR